MQFGFIFKSPKIGLPKFITFRFAHSSYVVNLIKKTNVTLQRAPFEIQFFLKLYSYKKILKKKLNQDKFLTFHLSGH